MLSMKVFNANMEMLFDTYQRRATKLTMKAYYLVCKEADDKIFERACIIAMENKRYPGMPSPGEIRLAIDEANYENELVELKEKTAKRIARYEELAKQPNKPRTNDSEEFLKKGGG